MKVAGLHIRFRILVHLFLIRPFLHLFCGVYITGRKHLEGLNQYILTANHNSHLDILLLFSVLPFREIQKTHPIAPKEYFSKNRILFWLAETLFHPIWIVRGDKEGNPLKVMKKVLRSGHNIIIFPEGTRGEPGVIAPFKTGVGQLAEEFRQIPIIPIYISGPERSFPKKSSLLLPLWNNITIGPPQICTGDNIDITDSLEKTIRGMSESERVSRHRRKIKKKTQFVAFLGIDGSGKSTLSREVAKQLSDNGYACLMTDRLEFFRNSTEADIQPLLMEKVREAIGAYAKKAQSLKHYKVPKLTELLLRDHLLGEVEKWYNPDYLIQDGSPLLNLVAWSVLFKGKAVDEETCAKALEILSGHAPEFEDSNPIYRQFKELRYLKKLGFAHLKLPEAVIFLDVDPTVCCERINRRGVRIQVHETEEKLAELRKGYRMVCSVIETEFHLPLLVVEGDQTLEQSTGSASKFIQNFVMENQTNE